MEQNEYLNLIKKCKLQNDKEIKSGKYKKVFLESLPTSNHNGKSIDWKNSINKKIYFIYNYIKGWIEIIEYEPKGQKLKVIYKDKKLYIQTSGILNCQLGNIIGTQTSEFKIEIGMNFKDDDRNITITDRKKIQSKTGQWLKYYKYKCNTCFFNGRKHYSIKDKEYKDELWILEGALLSGEGCSCCANKIVVENINSIVNTDPWMIPYIGEECAKTHTHGSHDYVCPICPDCGRIKTKAMKIKTIYMQKNIGCLCSDGKSCPEKFMFSILEQLKINFETEKIFDWCKYILKGREKKGRYDFYFELNNKKYIIEMDGDFHRKDNTISGQTAEESRIIDDEKDRLAMAYGIEKPFRINCQDSNLSLIKQNIFNSELKNLFDLSNIDWLQAEEFACTNLVKIACEYKRNNTNLTTVQIGKAMGLCHATIIKWLKKGTDLGWCYYNPKEEMSKIASVNGKNSGKQVEIFKDNKSLGIFESAYELSRQSEILFNIKLSFSQISSVCTGKIKTHKGYTFKHISKEEYEQRKIKEDLKQAI